MQSRQMNSYPFGRFWTLLKLKSFQMAVWKTQGFSSSELQRVLIGLHLCIECSEKFLELGNAHTWLWWYFNKFCSLWSSITISFVCLVSGKSTVHIVGTEGLKSSHAVHIVGMEGLKSSHTLPISSLWEFKCILRDSEWYCCYGMTLLPWYWYIASQAHHSVLAWWGCPRSNQPNFVFLFVLVVIVSDSSLTQWAWMSSLFLSPWFFFLTLLQLSNVSLSIVLWWTDSQMKLIVAYAVMDDLTDPSQSKLHWSGSLWEYFFCLQVCLTDSWSIPLVSCNCIPSKMCLLWGMQTTEN